MLEPLYTADEMRAAEAGHDVEQLMARAGRAVAEEAMRRFPQARRFVAVCGGGATKNMDAFPNGSVHLYPNYIRQATTSRSYSCSAANPGAGTVTQSP